MAARRKQETAKMTLEDINEFRLDVTRHAYEIQRSLGASHIQEIYETIDVMEGNFLNDDSDDTCQNIEQYMKSIRELIKLGGLKEVDGSSNVTRRLDLFGDYERELARHRKELDKEIKKDGKMRTVFYDSLSPHYYQIATFLAKMVKRGRGRLDGGMINIKKNDSFFDKETEEGITIVIRLKIKKENVNPKRHSEEG